MSLILVLFVAVVVVSIKGTLVSHMIAAPYFEPLKDGKGLPCNKNKGRKRDLLDAWCVHI